MESNTENGKPSAGKGGPAKWAALVDDQVVWSPSQKVAVKVLDEQAGTSGKVLVRDHNSPNDVVINRHEEVDLAKGNVFYTLDENDVKPRADCVEAAKL